MLLAELFPYANLVYNILLGLYFLTVLAVIVVVLSENRNPVKSMAWVLGLTLKLYIKRTLSGSIWL